MKKSQLRKIIRESIKELMNEKPQTLNEGMVCAGTPVGINGSEGDSCSIMSCCVGGQFLNCPGKWDCTQCVRDGDCTLESVLPGGSNELGTLTKFDLTPYSSFFGIKNKNMGTDDFIKEADNCVPYAGHACYVYVSGNAQCVGKWSCNGQACICPTGRTRFPK